MPSIRSHRASLITSVFRERNKPNHTSAFANLCFKFEHQIQQGKIWERLLKSSTHFNVKSQSCALARRACKSAPIFGVPKNVEKMCGGLSRKNRCRGD